MNNMNQNQEDQNQEDRNQEDQNQEETLLPPSLPAALLQLDPEDGEQILDFFQTHALLNREKTLLQKSVRDQKKLLVENGRLKRDIEELKEELERRRRRARAPPPRRRSPTPNAPANQKTSTGASAETDPAPSSSPQESRRRRRRTGRRAPPSSLSLGAEPRQDVSRLELRVGRVLSARRHPLVDSMVVTEVELGEESPRTVVSRLGGAEFHQLSGSLVVLLCNVKACKLRGVVSQARLLCCSASSEDRTELLTPPTGSAPGDRVTAPDYPGDPDPVLVSGLRLWERVQEDLRVDGGGVASYRGSGLQVRGRGLCRAPSLTHCSVIESSGGFYSESPAV